MKTKALALMAALLLPHGALAQDPVHAGNTTTRARRIAPKGDRP